ncbi:O-acetyltransferase OatA [compost metagenome]
MSNPNVKYRPEIDGLRAIAVLSVILFHAGFTSFSGGFVGVDIFFVISGFLITTILISDQEKSGISIKKFYQRRAKRIMPALFVVILATLPATWLFLPPAELKSYFSSIAATVTFSSNILFWYESGYWDTATSLKPLIHTWSLAVEEQYYIVFPLLVMAAWRLGRAWFTVIVVAIAAASLWFSERYLAIDQMVSFYMLPARAWELLAGSITALYLLRKATPIPSGVVNQVLSLGGLGMILYAIFSYTEKTPFPGINAAWPVVGTALLIATTGPRTLVGLILSSRPFVMIGLISYSAYLWHQPILAILKLRGFGDLTTYDSILAIAITALLSIISYRYVEQPVRLGKTMFGRKPIASTAIITAAFAGVAIYGFKSEGFPDRLDSVYSYQARKTEDLHRKMYVADTDPGTDKPVILIVGDSYLYNWSIGLSSVIDKTKYRIVSVSYLGCKYDKQVTSLRAEETAALYKGGCATFTQKMTDAQILNNTKKIFIVSHRPLTYQYNMHRFALYKKIQHETNNAPIYLVGNYFQLDAEKKQSCIVTMFISKQDAKICRDRSVFAGSEREGKYSSLMPSNYTYIDTRTLACGQDDRECPYKVEGVPFITDANHITATFATFLMNDITTKHLGYFDSIGLSGVFDRHDQASIPN